MKTWNCPHLLEKHEEQLNLTMLQKLQEGESFPNILHIYQCMVTYSNAKLQFKNKYFLFCRLVLPCDLCVFNCLYV